ncbi:MAG: protein kinase domain-containing protein [Phycisphaeraceae bacterium]
MAKHRIRSFNFQPGRKVGRRYVIEQLLGRGSEGEVYQIRDLDTDIPRAAKFYFPHRDPNRRLTIRHAQKLNALRNCPIVLQYHHSEVITSQRQPVVAMISELAEGERLQDWIDRHRGDRLHPHVALHVLYDLVRGLEEIHQVGEYHSDVHTENILIKPRGVHFDMKLIDFYDWGRPARYKQHQDIADTIRVFYDCLGGKPHYMRQPAELRHICAGLQRKRILQRFPTMTALRRHLEEFEWTTLSERNGQRR